MRLKGYAVLHDYSKKAVDILRPVLDVEVRATDDRPTHEELLQLVKQYDVLIIRVREKMTRDIYLNCDRLRIIGTLSSGVDHIDKSFFEDPRMKVVSTPFSNVISVAEHTFALILAVSKRIVQAHQAVISSEGRKGITSLPVELDGKVLGVIGAGKIGSKVMQMAKTFGLKVICFTYHPERHRELEDIGVAFVPLVELLEQADIVSLHLPLSDISKGILSEQRIKLMKRGAIVISTARSDLVDNEALSKALVEGRIGGAGIDDLGDSDVWILKEIRNVVLSPHIGGLTRESTARMDLDLATYLTEYLRSRPDDR